MDEDGMVQERRGLWAYIGGTYMNRQNVTKKDSREKDEHKT